MDWVNSVAHKPARLAQPKHELRGCTVCWNILLEVRLRAVNGRTQLTTCPVNEEVGAILGDQLQRVVMSTEVCVHSELFEQRSYMLHQVLRVPVVSRAVHGMMPRYNANVRCGVAELCVQPLELALVAMAVLNLSETLG